MSNSELLRIKNKQKTPYKNTKSKQAVMKYHIKRPNDRFGLKAKGRNHHRHILPVGKRFRKCEPQGEGKGKKEKGGRKSQKSQKSQRLKVSYKR